MKKVKFKICIVIDNKINYNTDAIKYGIKDIIKCYLYNIGLSSRVSIDEIKIGVSKNQALFEMENCKIVTRLLDEDDKYNEMTIRLGIKNAIQRHLRYNSLHHNSNVKIEGGVV